MPQRAKTICRYTGCMEIVDTPGHCPKHKATVKERFRGLDKKKTPEAKRFYSSYKWTKRSLSHRKKYPLCAKCLEERKYTYDNLLVHHNPSLAELKAKGLNPFSETYLETICFNHHQAELRAKRKTLTRPGARVRCPGEQDD